MREERRRHVDGGWAWVVLLASFMNLLLASGFGFLSGIFQKLFLEQFSKSVAFTAWVTALFCSFMQLAGPLSGLLTSATNCRVTVMIGGALLAGGMAASYFATSLEYLLVSFGLVAGIGLGLMYTPSIVIVNFFFERRRTMIMGVALSASGLGITGTPLLSRFLIDHFSWRETMMIFAAIGAQICVFGAVMFPVHEPPSRCLRLCCRWWGLPQPEDVDSYPCPDGNVTENKQCVSSQDKLELATHNSSTEHKCEDGKFGSGDFQERDVGFVLKVDDVDDIEIKDGDEVENAGDESVEQTLLLENTNKSGSSKGENSSRKLCSDKTTITFSQQSRSQPQTPERHFRSRKLQNEVSHHSRRSLNDISDQVNGAQTSPTNGQSSSRQFSHSAHNLDSLHQVPHHPPAHKLACSLLSVHTRGTSRGSKVDVRAITIYSSVQSLHSLGAGLPTAGRGLASSSPDPQCVDDEQDVVEESGGDGEGGGSKGGGNWMIFKNVPFLFLCLNLFLSNMACGIFNIHLPGFSQQRGLNDQDIALVLAMDGVAVFVSRILVGALGHDENVDKLVVYFGLHLLASFVQACFPLVQDMKGIIVMTFLMGLYYGSVYSLLASLTISVLGLPSLAFAFGVEMIFAGLGYLVAPPLAGLVVDETGNYDSSMYLGGFLMFLSAISLLCLTCGRPPGSPPIGYQPPAP